MRLVEEEQAILQTYNYNSTVSKCAKNNRHSARCIKSGGCEELHWSVTDPNDESSIETSLGYCKNLDCTRYKSLEIFENRIEIRRPVRGTLFVKQLWKNDLLKYTCNVQRERKKRPLFDHINVSSSVDCK